jgi:two-component system, sensor histidine kinase YesM
MRLPHFANTAISGKLMAYFLAIILIPVLTLGILGPMLFSRSMEREASDSTTRMLSQVTRGVEFYAKETEKLIDLLASSGPVRDLFDGEDIGREGRKAILDLQGEIVGACPELAGCLVLTDGDELVSADYSRLSRDALTDEPWYRQARERPGTLVLAPRPYGRNLRGSSGVVADDVVSVAKAIQRADGRVGGLILIDLRLSVVEAVFQDTSFGQSGFLFIVDPQGQLVYAPPNRVVYRIPVASFSSANPIRIVRQAGVDYQVISRLSAYTGWRAFGVFSLAESRRAAGILRWYSIAIGVVTMLASAVAALFITRSIARPILALERLMKKAERGDLAVRFAEERSDEIGKLGHGFNAMIATMQGLIDQVYVEQKLKREMELRILQEQIKPHFLYNTLDTIQWMAQENGADELVKVVVALTNLFRIGLSRGQELIPLAQELKHVESYLYIQKARYLDKFEYAVEGDPELSGCHVVRLILQPLVENAIYHGIKERRGAGRLSIQAERSGGCLLLRVTDDGVGMGAEKMEELNRLLGSDDRDGAEGFGVHNVNARIRLAYGKNYGLSFRAAPGGGTVAEIRHPVILEGE